MNNNSEMWISGFSFFLPKRAFQMIKIKYELICLSPLFIFLFFTNGWISLLSFSFPFSLPLPLPLPLVAVCWAAPLGVSGFGPLGRCWERWWRASKSVPGVVVRAAKCGQSSWPLLGAKHIIGPWKEEKGVWGWDNHGIHCKLIGHKTFLRTHAMKKTQQQKLSLSLSLEVLSLKLLKRVWG